MSATNYNRFFKHLSPIGSLLLIVLLVFIGHFTAMGNPFRYLKTENGLNSGEINHIVQDHNGMIWIATWTGLTCYDGYQFTNFRPVLGDPASLPDKKVKKLHVDNNGNLWMATEKFLVRMNMETHRFQTFQFDRVSNDPINILHINELSGFIVVHAVEGFYIVPIDQDLVPGYKIQKIRIFENDRQIFNYFHYSKSTANQQLVCASNTGALKTSLVFFMHLSVGAKDTLLQVDCINNLNGAVRYIQHPENKNNLFFATDKGVFLYDLLYRQFLPDVLFENKNLQLVHCASDNLVYASGNDQVLFYHDLATGLEGNFMANPNRQGALLNSNIMSLFEDFSGNLWVGHQGQGISILNLNRKEFHTIRRDPLLPKPLSSNAVMCFNSNDEYLLVGCRSGGINIARRSEVSSAQPGFEILDPMKIFGEESSNTGIWDIARQSDSLYWVASSIGLLKLHLEKKGWVLERYGDDQVFREMIRKIFIDRYQNIWFGTMLYGLVFVPNPVKNPQARFYRFSFDRNDSCSLSDNVVLSILLDRQDVLWVGTVNGLNRMKGYFHELDLKGNIRPEVKFDRLIGTKPTTDFLNNNEINCIYENSDGTIWVATQGGGINIFNKGKGSFSYLTTNEGLPGNDVFGILSDEGNNLWISTDKGIAFYNQSLQKPAITVYNFWDGLQGDIFMVNAYYKTTDGQLFFGGENGFTSFNPVAIKPNSIKPKTVFTDLKVFNKRILVGDTLRRYSRMEKTLNETKRLVLPYQKNSFSIGIAAIHYQYPEGNSVSYCLEGFQNQWVTIPASEKYIHFTKLPAGEYTLKAFAISSDNIADDQIRTLTIKILPPWYREWYVSVLLLISGLLLITFFVFVVINRQRQIYLQRIYDITIENNESKMMFLANIAHELRTPLSLIISPIKDMMLSLDSVDKKWHKHIELINRNSNYLLKLIDQIIDFRRLDAGKLKLNLRNEDLGLFIEGIAANFKAFENKQNVTLHVDIPKEPLMVQIDSQKIEEVLYNLLSNAFKHTPINGSIHVSAALESASEQIANVTNQQIRITVFNQGKEIAEADMERIFERFFKADDTIDGAGIGLSFAKSLIEMHKGVIKAESIANQGVAFHVFLPFETPGSIIEKDSFIGLVNHNITNEPEKGKLYDFNAPDALADKMTKILIVEDNEDLRKFMAGILSRYYSCYEAPDGIEGFKLTKEILPDVVITDVVMPRLDGYGLVKMIKEEMKTCHIPVIMLTAKNASEHIINGYQSGVDVYVTKPFDTNVILSQISRLIKNRELIHEKYKKQNFMVEVSAQYQSRDDEFLNSVRKLLDKHLGDPDFNVKELSDEMQMSTTQLYRKIKGLTGYSPVEFLRITRLHKAHDLLALQKYSIKEVCYQTGFNNLSYFVKCFREYFGVTPASYRDKGIS